LFLLIYIFIFKYKLYDDDNNKDALYRYLEKFGLHRNNQHKIFGDVEKCIYQFIQKGYLEKEKSAVPNEEVTFLYKWGPRSLVEFPEKNLFQFITGVNI